MSTDLSRQEKRQLKDQGRSRKQIREFEKNGGESSQDLVDLQQQATNKMLDRFEATSEQKISTEQLKQDIALNRAMDTVLDRYGITKINKKRLHYLVEQGVYKRNPDMQWFEVVRTPNTDMERKKIERFNARARKNSCKTLETMMQYDQDNTARIENENKSNYLARKNKRLEAEPKYKDLINVIGYVPTIARDEVVQENLNPEQVILQMQEDFDNNVKYYEAVKVLEQLQTQYGVGPDARMTGTGYQGTQGSHAGSQGSYPNGGSSSPTTSIQSNLRNCGLMGVVNNFMSHTNATPGQRGVINTTAQIAVILGGIWTVGKFAKSLRSGEGWIADTIKDKAGNTSPWKNRLITIGSALGIYAGTAAAFGRNPFQVANDLVFGGPTTQKIGQFVDQIANAGSKAGGEALAGLQNTIQTSVKTAEKYHQDINSNVVGPLWTNMLLEDMTVEDLVSAGILTEQGGKMVCSIDNLKNYTQECLDSSDSTLIARGQRINAFIEDVQNRHHITESQMSVMILGGVAAMGIGLATIKDEKSISYDVKTIGKYYDTYTTVSTQFNTYLTNRGLQTVKGVTSTQLQHEMEAFVNDGQLSDLDIDALIQKGILEVKAGKSWILDSIYKVDSAYLSDADKSMLNIARNQVNQMLDLTNKIDDQIKFDYDPQTNKLYIDRNGVQTEIRKDQNGFWYFGNFARGYKLPAQAGEFVMGANLMCKIISLYQGKGEQKPYFQYQAGNNWRFWNTTGSDIEFNKQGALDTEVVGGGLWSNLAEMMPMINGHLDEFVSALNNMPYFDPGYTAGGQIIRVQDEQIQNQTQSSPSLNQYAPTPNTVPGVTGLESGDIYDQTLATLSSLTAQDKQSLIQARKDINTKLNYTNHLTNNIKFVVEGNTLLVKGGYTPIQLSKQADGKWQVANFPILFGPHQLSEALYIANLTGLYISKLHNQGSKAQPWEVSSRTDINSVTGRDIEFEHKDNTFNRAGLETTTTTGGRRGRLDNFAPSIDEIDAKRYYVDRLNAMPYRYNYSGTLPTHGLTLDTDQTQVNTSTNTGSSTNMPTGNHETSSDDNYTLDTNNGSEPYNAINTDQSSRIDMLNTMLSTTVGAKQSIKQISDQDITTQLEAYNHELFHTRGIISYIRDGDMIKIKYRQQTLDLTFGTLEECMRTLNLIDYALDYIAQNKIPLYDLKIGTKENVGIIQGTRNGGGSIEGYLYRPRDIANTRPMHDLIITPQDIVEAVGLGGKTNEELTRDPLLRRQVNNFKTFMNAMRIVLQHNISPPVQT